MRNSSGAQDYDLSAIEAAVKETARGRAFLASYARRVRQSDTLTMLAMLARLERWCQGQAARFAELDGKEPVEGKLDPVPALDHFAGAANQSSGGGRFGATCLDSFAEEIGDPRSIVEVRANHRSELDLSRGDPNRTAMHRLEELATALSDLEQRAAELSSRLHADMAPAMPAEGHATWSAAPSQAIGQSGVVLTKTSSPRQPGASDEIVLDNIAKALGTVT